MRLRSLTVAVLVTAVTACTGGDGDGAGRRGARQTRRPSDAPLLQWRRDALGSDILPSGGRLLAADGERVYVASGFGEVNATHIVTGLDRASGSTRWTATRAGPVFLHGVVGDVLVVSEQADVVAGIEAATGTERWVLHVRDLGLSGYGATIGVIAEGVTALGLSARGEGDTRPPVVLGLDAASGLVRWQAALAPGTDLNFGQPTVVDGAAVFLSTPSHPGSAPGNVAHAVNLSDGSVRWNVDLGGGQGFHVAGPIASPAGGVHLPGAGAVITVDSATGAVRWRRDSPPVAALATVGPRLWLLEPNRIVFLDPASGNELSARASNGTFLGPYVLTAAPDAHVVLAADQQHGAGLDRQRASTRWSLNWPAPLYDVPLVSQPLLVVATGDRAVTAYELPV
jgi:outer membrane protein assembly factor BamB